MYSSIHLQRSGFTAIELAALVVILGVLAIASLPRYLDLRAQAYHASLEGTAAAFSSAVQLAHLTCIVKHGAGASDLAGYGDGDADFNSSCFPTAADGPGNGNGNNGNGNGNGGSAALTAAGCARIWNQILAAAPGVSRSASSAYRASASGNACLYALQRDRSAMRSFSYDPATGTVRVVSNP
jgi:MSHA pilin protein MshB